MLKTAECVTPKHPDKLCDQISDAILDACLKEDPFSRVAVETMGGHGKIIVMGEVTTKAKVNYVDVVMSVVGPTYEIYSYIVSQSPEIAKGVDTGGAGDQGIMVGYACSDNEDLIPQEEYLARSLCRFIYNVFPFDGKTQITINNKGEIVAMVASFQNAPQKSLVELLGQWFAKTQPTVQVPVFHANPAGDWNQGGFEADTGLTGRKLMVDNYGPQVAIGGGAFSGKDATKVDRSAAYMARKIAVSILKKVNAKEVTVKLAYAIGVPEPVMVSVNVDGKDISDGLEWISKDYNLTPKGIIEHLKLRDPQYQKTAEWGHFGNGFIWDK